MPIRLETDILRIWEQMNKLLGHKVLSLEINMLTNAESDLQATTQLYGKPLYVLTPEEVRRHIPISIGNNEPDPRKERVKNSIIRKTANKPSLPNDNKNKPIYYLAESYSTKSSKKAIRIYEADLLNPVPLGSPIMQQIGLVDNTPVICFSYGIHAGSYCHTFEHKEELLQRMRKVGISSDY